MTNKRTNCKIYKTMYHKNCQFLKILNCSRKANTYLQNATQHQQELSSQITMVNIRLRAELIQVCKEKLSLFPKLSDTCNINFGMHTQKFILLSLK